MTTLLNDVHSQLNPTEVFEVSRPASLKEIQVAITRAKSEGLNISMSGGCHAMGGQQFARGALHLDLTAIDTILETFPEEGLLHCESGVMWPAMIEAAQAMASPHKLGWGIRQKQTGVDNVSLAGSIAANAHGRGLAMQPLGEDIEEMTVVLATGEVVICSREQNQELFSLVIGGYGLFGVIYSAKLRLSPRQKLKRIVNVIDIDDAANAIYRRLEEGCTFGDFQYAIDSSGDEFLYRGVFSCYKPVDPELPIDDKQSDLPQDAWLKLLKLAHENKREAFKLYSQHYVGTDGQLYWSDTMQLSTYIPTYVDFLEKHATHEEVVRKESLMIGEHYVPHDHTIGFMHLARQILKENSVEVIYGTIRVIKKDKTSFLPWAKQDYACIIFNLRTIHTPEEIDKVATTFRGLIEASLSFGGSFFLTYHHFATPDQIARAYPQIREFFAAKRLHDPDELFQSEWYRVYREAFASAE